MVKICDTEYPCDKYNEYFEKYPYTLSSFQKWAIEAIVEGQHILVTAHTGSGKTLPAEFAIDYFVNKGKKVIYTSPIKALSNQKFYEFKQKFPHISFGILTGDIKTNPEADVLIMTTEILMNTLYIKQQPTNNQTMFEMDFHNELACVIFDEVHYINDAERGKVWEETIMLLPPHIQMVMLSATLDAPEKFAAWCETRGAMSSNYDKQVYLASTYHRVVPLTHYSFITCTQGIFKVLKDKQLEMEIMKTTNSLHAIQSANGVFSDTNYQKVRRVLDVFEDKNHFVKRQHVLNTVSRHLVDHNMLPAICFVLNRKSLEQCAHEITTVLLEDDSKVPYIVHRECEQIIRKLPNYSEYLSLPEYLKVVALLEKGIAIHHAGMMPILREMVELMFAKGYVKLLFATETFAVGINMPTKTVLFTDISKFDGSGVRPLYSHEYTQMAGRAGRRGIDTVGHVIHLTNLFRISDKQTIQTVMKGVPQTLTSKFKVSYNLLLSLVNMRETDYVKYTQRSMIQNDIEMNLTDIRRQMTKLKSDVDGLTTSLQYCRTPIESVNAYISLKQQRQNSVNKKRKEADRAIAQLSETYKDIEKDLVIVTHYNDKLKQLDKLKEELKYIENSMSTTVKQVLDILYHEGFVDKEDGLTMKGQIARHIREVHCLVFADMIESGRLKSYTAKQLVGIFSCFTNVSVPEEKRELMPNSTESFINDCVQTIQEKYDRMRDLELDSQLDTGADYALHYDLIDASIQWCCCVNDAECKQLLQVLHLEKDVFLGEFIKAILKINNISAELEKVAEYLGDMEFLSVLKEIPTLTLKYVATNQSLYV